MMEKIVIVGGGAGGLELASFLGRQIGEKVQITLVDRNLDHLWKPLFHEVATGALDPGVAALSYSYQASKSNFKFRQGNFIGIDRENKTIKLDKVVDEHNHQIVPETDLAYDKLVIAIGSGSNDFGIPGVRENCVFLDAAKQAKAVQKRIFNLFVEFENNNEAELNIAIVGGGATGVETAAEIYSTILHLNYYGFRKINKNTVKVTLIEASPKLVGMLPEKISKITLKRLQKAGVAVHLETMVTEVHQDCLHTKDGQTFKSDLTIWATGVKAPEVTTKLGLELNRINQIQIKDTLQSTIDDNIFVIGDCAGLMQNDKPVPASAQAAHQMAVHCSKNIIAILKNKKPTAFKFFNKGMLLSFSEFGMVGSLKGDITLKGPLARMAYRFIYRSHQAALHGWFKTCVIMLGALINKFIRPLVKLN